MNLPAKILDVSYSQPEINYADVARQIDGVIIRCGRTGWGKLEIAKDTHFEKHYAGFKATGIPIGVYYYSAAPDVATARREAQAVCEYLRGKQLALPVYFDVENNERQGDIKSLTDITEAFCAVLEREGFFAGYYAYTAWLLAKFDNKKLSKYTLWKADYRASPDKTIPCDMHQYSCKESISGIKGGVDMSNCYKDFPTIIVSAGLNGFDKPDPMQALQAENADLKARLVSIGKIVQGE